MPEEADARRGRAGGGAEDDWIEAEEEAVGIHGALQLRLPLLLPIGRHGRRFLLGGRVGARFRRRRAPLELEISRGGGRGGQIGRAHV